MARPTAPNRGWNLRPICARSRPGQLQLDDELAVRSPPAGAANPGLQRLAPRRGAPGEARERAGEALALAQDVEHVAVAGRVAPGRPLPGAQTPPGISDGVI